jgi:hypothetical protein
MRIRIGLILMFEGDFRKVSVAIKNVSSFSAVTAILVRGDQDVTGTYINDGPTSSGNLIITGIIGDKAALIQGNYRYFVTGTYSTNKKRTWYWDIIVLPQDLSLLAGIDISTEDYDPFADKLTIYEGDKFAKELIIPGAEFTAATGKFRLLADDVTATYCSGSASFSGESLTTHNIGGAATIPAGDYGYFLTGTCNDGEMKATWCYPVKVLSKQGVLP